MSDATFFLHDHRIEKSRIEQISEMIEKSIETKVSSHIFKKRKNQFEAGSTLFVMAGDEDFGEWLEHIRHIDVKIVILPFEENRLSCETFLIPADIEEAIKLVRKESVHLFDEQILCNGKVLIGCVTAGQSGWIKGKGLKALIAFFGKDIFSLKLFPLNIITEKEKEISAASLLVEVGVEATMHIKRPYFFKASDNQCRRIASVIYAPQSILGTVRLRFLLAKRKINPSESLPPGVGTIKSDRLIFKSGNGAPIQINLDTKVSEAKEIVFETIKSEAKIVTGWKGCSGTQEKESIRIQNIPQERDLLSFFSKRSLPLVPIASEESFAELFQRLRSSAKMSASYTLLLIVSVLMATTGLFQNSSPTIIGAMILAPLMAPIVALSMGAIRFEGSLLKRSLRTISLSTAVALLLSALYAWMLPFTHITTQMAMRTHPTLLDLAVALFSGIAASYGYANSKVSESLAGVAIAVALVPPLCVAGIGLGWGSVDIFLNAFLLFLANIAGIIIATGATFFILGYASTKYASTALVIKMLMVALIAAPLLFSTQSLLEDEKIYTTFSKLDRIKIGKSEIKVLVSGIHHEPDGKYVELNILSEKELSRSEKEMIKRVIRSKLEKEVGIIVNYGYKL